MIRPSYREVLFFKRDIPLLRETLGGDVDEEGRFSLTSESILAFTISGDHPNNQRVTKFVKKIQKCTIRGIFCYYYGTGMPGCVAGHLIRHLTNQFESGERFKILIRSPLLRE
jgi:hypothetical protein